MHSYWKWVWPENETMVNLKSASFVVIVLLHEGLTHVHSQKQPRLHFRESFALISQHVYISWYNKYFVGSSAKQCCSILLNTWSRRGLVLKHRKTVWREHKMVPYSSSGVIRVPNSFEKTQFILISISTRPVCGCKRSTVHQGSLCVPQINLASRDLDYTEISCLKPFHVYFWLICNIFKHVPICFSCVLFCELLGDLTFKSLKIKHASCWVCFSTRTFVVQLRSVVFFYVVVGVVHCGTRTSWNNRKNSQTCGKQQAVAAKLGPLVVMIH